MSGEGESARRRRYNLYSLIWKLEHNSWYTSDQDTDQVILKSTAVLAAHWASGGLHELASMLTFDSQLQTKSKVQLKAHEKMQIFNHKLKY